MMVGLDERRRCTRYAVRAPLQYNCEYRAPNEPTRSLNMSESGALIATRGFIAPRSNITLNIFLKSGYFVMRSRVAHVEKQPQDSLYHAGIEFMDRTRDFVMKFHREMADLELFKIQRSKELGREVSLSEASARWYEKAPPMM